MKHAATDDLVTFLQHRVVDATSHLHAAVKATSPSLKKYFLYYFKICFHNITILDTAFYIITSA